MVEITEASQLAAKAKESGNELRGPAPAMWKSKVVFHGKNNVLYCEEGVRLSGSDLHFKGDNALIYLRSGKNALKLGIEIYTDNVFAIGRDAYTNGKLVAVLSEGRHVIIGDNALLSFGIWVRTADPHLVYDVATHERINPSRNVFLGDHVWVGQSVMLLKGTVIGSGSIIGAGSVVSGKTIPSNASWAGNPVRSVRDGVFWNVSCVHNWGVETTEERWCDDGEGAVFGSGPGEPVDIGGVFAALDSLDFAASRLEYLREHNDRHDGGDRYFIPVTGSEAASLAVDEAWQKKGLFGRKKS